MLSLTSLGGPVPAAFTALIRYSYCLPSCTWVSSNSRPCSRFEERDFRIRFQILRNIDQRNAKSDCVSHILPRTDKRKILSRKIDVIEQKIWSSIYLLRSFSHFNPPTSQHFSAFDLVASYRRTAITKRWLPFQRNVILIHFERVWFARFAWDIYETREGDFSDLFTS